MLWQTERFIKHTIKTYYMGRMLSVKCKSIMHSHTHEVIILLVAKHHIPYACLSTCTLSKAYVCEHKSSTQEASALPT